jgi:tetratricopeptide (TPR) repeat protein
MPPGLFAPSLDPNVLIERSQPVRRGERVWVVAGSFVFVMLISTWASTQSQELAAAVRLMSALAMVGTAIGLAAYSWNTAQKRNDELRRLEKIEEFVQLRQWPAAAGALWEMLSVPMRSPQARVQALVYLGTVYGRLQRYADAVTVQEYILSSVMLDDSSSHALRCGRAMAMLHEDRLVDADRAIGELRRSGPGQESSGLVLVEIYRDVKTGHPNEAIELFREKLPQLTRQLGHRVADAWALVARAYDMVGQAALAAQAYFNASALMPIADVSGRYAEVAALTGRYAPAPAPSE